MDPIRFSRAGLAPGLFSFLVGHVPFSMLCAFILNEFTV